MSGAAPAEVITRYQELDRAFEKGNRIDAFMEKLAERRRREKEAAGQS